MRGRVCKRALIKLLDSAGEILRANRRSSLCPMVLRLCRLPHTGACPMQLTQSTPRLYANTCHAFQFWSVGASEFMAQILAARQNFIYGRMQRCF
jgi:hypothetical protein